ncbi:hypothetical protein [Streptomyces noursei]|uniref:hypothetical protein n=1 Tax=Streptomyces noursei TaxID=1971 RepID=UPI0016783BD2|nr:hypothetical protein [Streptomyces noursei]MCZ1021376.1 hypothetical protein [Streptomyces noursei]GGX54388.1 hypothetical protein GCM10010341_89360 [Streptomyces noursei]
MSTMPRARRAQTVPAARRQPPATPKPDYRKVFLEPRYPDPSVAADYEQQWEDEQAARRTKTRGPRHRTD